MQNDIRLETLSEQQIKMVYHTYLVHDFPQNERKPLSRILKALKEDQYECYGMIEKEQILGYAFFVKHADDYLLDYLAVTSENRNRGLGSLFLALLKEKFADTRSILVEVENPEFAKTDEERNLQTRRVDFYIRNGLVDTTVKATTFGVPYLILQLVTSEQLPADEIRRLYQEQYRVMLPKLLFQMAIKM